MNKYLFLDTETGGFNKSKDALLSAALILTDQDFNIITQYYSLFNDPTRNCSDEALAINKLTRDQIAAAPCINESVLTTIQLQLWQSNIIVAHNAAFDLPFLGSYGVEYNGDHTLDTMHVAWDVWPGQKAKLGMVCDRVGIDSSGAHNAYDDTIMVIKLIKWFIANEHLSSPLPKYKLVLNYYPKKAFGYKKQTALGLQEKRE